MKVGTCRVTDLFYQICISGNHVYAATRKGLRVFDVSTPLDPREVAHYDISGYYKQLVVNGDYIYLAIDDSGLFIFQALANNTVNTAAAVPILEIRGGANGYIDPEKNEYAAIILRPQTSGEVVVNIYSLRGQLVWNQLKNVMAGNLENFRWDAINMKNERIASGVYLVHVKGAGIDEKKKVIVVR
jgi:hypothetical protein